MRPAAPPRWQSPPPASSAGKTGPGRTWCRMCPAMTAVPAAAPGAGPNRYQPAWSKASGNLHGAAAATPTGTTVMLMDVPATVRERGNGHGRCGLPAAWPAATGIRRWEWAGASGVPAGVGGAAPSARWLRRGRGGRRCRHCAGSGPAGPHAVRSERRSGCGEQPGPPRNGTCDGGTRLPSSCLVHVRPFRECDFALQDELAARPPAATGGRAACVSLPDGWAPAVRPARSAAMVRVMPMPPRSRTRARAANPTVTTTGPAETLPSMPVAASRVR